MIPMRLILRERGPTPRKLRTATTQATKKAFFEGGVLFHATMMDNRFTPQHARAAGYTPRKRAYEGRKFRQYRHRRPLEFSGRARRLSRTARITSTSKGVVVRYPGLRVLNFRHPESQVNMLEEFTRILAPEVSRVAEKIDRVIDQELNVEGTTTTQRIA